MDELDRLRQENEVLKKEVEKLESVKAHQKEGMIKKAVKGNPMSRAPFGYVLVDGALAPAENFSEIEEIFGEFLQKDMSLRQLSEKHGLSVNGLKKVLKNFTGEIEQVPPVYSAIKIKGVPAYKLARRGENRTVIFNNPHRLIALFFGAMGINEHAHVKLQTV